MPATSLVGIANLALGKVSEQALTSLNDATTPGAKCRQFIYQAIREVLAESKWKCARGQAELSELATAPTFGWDNAFQLPTDYVRIVSFNEVSADDQFQELFEIQGTTLLTDEPTASIVYVKDLTSGSNTVAVMPPLMVKACYLNLAAKLAWPLAQSRTLETALEEAAEKAVRKAAIRDASEEFKPLTDRAAGSNWLASRHAGSP